ncbi:phage tail protein [Myxococcaceae bacterium JPH2]|nr:phage tail protein [Myxococcaceae bacterium JPH2]
MSNETIQHRKPVGTLRQFHKRIEIDKTEYDIRCPTSGEKIDVLVASQKAGDLDANNQPVDYAAGLRFLARTAIASLYYPSSSTHVFTQEDMPTVKNEPWLEQYGRDFAAAFAGQTVAEARGNSEATPS